MSVVPTGQLKTIKKRIEALEKRVEELEAKRPTLTLSGKNGKSKKTK